MIAPTIGEESSMISVVSSALFSMSSSARDRLFGAEHGLARVVPAAEVNTTVDAMVGALCRASGAVPAEIGLQRASSSLRRRPVTLIEATERGEGYALRAVIAGGRLHILAREVAGHVGVGRVKDVVISSGNVAAIPVEIDGASYVLVVGGQSWAGEPGRGPNIREIDDLAQSRHSAFLESAKAFRAEQAAVTSMMRTSEDR